MPERIRNTRLLQRPLAFTVWMVAITSLFACDAALAFPTRSYFRIDVNVSAVFDLQEPAQGGMLSVVNLSDDVFEEIIVPTSEGESPESIGGRIADELLGTETSKLMPTIAFPPDYDFEALRRLWRTEGAVAIYGRPGEVVIGGTETGLGILPPVGSLSAFYDEQRREYNFRWHEKSEYTHVYVRRLGKQRGGPAAKSRVLGDVIPFHTSTEKEYSEFRRRPYYVVGFRNGLPTNASYIVVDQREQVDGFIGPFTNNITTNWTGWSTEADTVNFLEKPFSDDWLAPPLDSGRANVRRSAQLVLSDRTGGQGGLYRSFIAQTPGKIYRPSIRYRVMEEAADFAGEWSFDIMVGAISMGRSYELDEATRVRDADAWSELASSASHVRTWRADHSAGDAGAWVVSETGSGGSSVPQKDIKLDEERTAIFICVRLTGLKPNGIAMDSVRLQDVTESGVH
ncbi:MAG: hypothetical protein KF886_03760 [Candidatus Hydrogenedentes bacterium]|nr:hypothetical protein [Candidatus Hydrogenedentota bacterium]